MTILIISLIILAALAAVSIIIGIINWVILSASSSKVAFLEAEIDKKTREFDAIKKERSSSSEAAQVLAGTFNPEPQGTMLEKGGDDSQIEIVRNVRSGGVDYPDQSILARETQTMSRQKVAEHLAAATGPVLAETPEYMQPAQQADTPRQQASPQSAPFSRTTESGQWNIPVAPLGSPGEIAGQVSDVLEVVNERGSISMKPPLQQPNMVSIPLYSETAQNADFASAWQIISESLHHMQQPCIVLDLNGIHYLYDQEVGYLEQFVQAAAASGASMVFSNCRGEIATILQSRHGLAGLIQNT